VPSAAAAGTTTAAAVLGTNSSPPAATTVTILPPPSARDSIEFDVSIHDSCNAIFDDEFEIDALSGADSGAIGWTYLTVQGRLCPGLRLEVMGPQNVPLHTVEILASMGAMCQVGGRRLSVLAECFILGYSY
jgi:hypothetical protein